MKRFLIAILVLTSALLSSCRAKTPFPYAKKNGNLITPVVVVPMQEENFPETEYAPYVEMSFRYPPTFIPGTPTPVPVQPVEPNPTNPTNPTPQNPIEIPGMNPIDPSTDMLTWMNSQLPENTYVAAHADKFENGAIVSRTNVYQPHKTAVDYEMGTIYWRKDVMADFYGEIFSFDNDQIALRAETFPIFPGVDPAGTWDQRDDRFRLFAKDAPSMHTGGLGRVLAPRRVSFTWNHSGRFDTYRCESFPIFQQGKCVKYQSQFLDNSVFLTQMAPFSTVYDGEQAGWPATSEFKTFDRAIVINQHMQNDTARERFFFAVKDGVYYGFVRWDYSIRVNGQWVVKDRSVGLKRATDSRFSFNGMRPRAAKDVFPFKGGLRVTSSEGSSRPCPAGLMNRGSFSLPANSDARPMHVYDLSGYNTHAETTNSVCSNYQVALTLSSGCPVSRRRGSLYVASAQVLERIEGLNLVNVNEGWVTLCSMNDSWDVYFALGSAGCENGDSFRGAYRMYKDCYDAGGRRCSEQSPFMGLCSSRRD